MQKPKSVQPIVEIDPEIHPQTIWRAAPRLDKKTGFWSELLLAVPEGQGLLCRLPSARHRDRPGEACAGPNFMETPTALVEIPEREGQRLAEAAVSGSHARVFRLGSWLLQVASMSRIANPTGVDPVVEFWFEAEAVSALRTRILAHHLEQGMPLPVAAPGRLRL